MSPAKDMQNPFENYKHLFQGEDAKAIQFQRFILHLSKLEVEFSLLEFLQGLDEDHRSIAYSMMEWVAQGVPIIVRDPHFSEISTNVIGKWYVTAEEAFKLLEKEDSSDFSAERKYLEGFEALALLLVRPNTHLYIQTEMKIK
ncbi:MAG: hypothetical protein ACPGO7_01125, partial [Alphaproteobacteria bacterium]